MLGITAKQLDRIGVAIDEQLNQLVETVDDGICLGVDKLFEVCHAENVASAVHRTASNINIGSLDVCTVCVTSAKRQENEPVLDVRIGSQKIILSSANHRLDLLNCHLVHQLSDYLCDGITLLCG